VAQTSKGSAADQTFLIFSLKWETEKHDLDLSVTDPLGQVFNYDNRSKKGADGKLVIDSRTGPGIELWQSSRSQKGRYRVDIKFYNAYGNSKPAIVNLGVLSRAGETAFKPFEMDFSNQKRRHFISILMSMESLSSSHNETSIGHFYWVKKRTFLLSGYTVEDKSQDFCARSR
jgi:hypothetical protein